MELHVRSQRQGSNSGARAPKATALAAREASHCVARHTAGHLSHGSCPAGSSNMAPETRFASRPAAYFGTPLTRISPDREFYLRPQRQGSHSAPPARCGTPLTRIVFHREHHPQLQRQGSHSVPPLISARPSRESCLGKSSIHGQLRRPPPVHFGARLTQVVPQRELHLRPQSAPSRGSYPTRSSAHLCTLAPQQPRIRTATRRAVYGKKVAPCATREFIGLRISPGKTLAYLVAFSS